MPIPITILPEQTLLVELLDYDPETGDISWKTRDPKHFKSRAYADFWNSRYAGKPAFTSRTSGYTHGTIFDVAYRGHRVIWKWMTGEEPDFIDHINGTRDDNRWSNLRSVPKVENEKNVKLRIDNTSGHVGVQWSLQMQKWSAQVHVNNRIRHLGFYHSIDDAIRARKAGERKYNFHENHGKIR